MGKDKWCGVGAGGWVSGVGCRIYARKWEKKGLQAQL